MAIQKANLNINFAQGLDKKSDPFQVAPGRFLRLVNTVFATGNSLQKRNGYGPLAAIEDETATFLTTFNGNLTAIGSNLNAYIDSSKTWVNKGSLQPCSLDVLSLIKNSTNQTQADMAISPRGLVCTAYTDATSSTSVTYKYAIASLATGQNVVIPTELTATAGVVAGSPRVFLLRNYFVIVYPTLNGGTYSLQYTAISTTTNIAKAPANISAQYQPADSGVAFDGIVANNSLYLAWNGSDIGDALRMTYIDSTLTQHNTVVFATIQSTQVSVCADISGSTPIIWATSYNNATDEIYVQVTNQALSTVLDSTFVDDSFTLANIASVATDGSLVLFREISNTYAYDSTIATNAVDFVKIAQSNGAITATGSIGLSVGLASKPFIFNDILYVLTAYDSINQPTYFLMGSENAASAVGFIVAKLAYQNGGGYLTQGLPAVALDGATAYIPYLFKDLIEAVNKTQGVDAPNGVYSQTGINLGTFTLGTDTVVGAEIGANLHLTGGFLWAYDGYTPVESGFFLYPDYIETASFQNAVVTGDTTDTSTTITSVTSSADIVPGMNISGTGIQADTTVTAYNSSANTITLSKAATASNTGTSLTLTGNVADSTYFYAVTYEWADNQGNIIRSAPSIPVSIVTSSKTAIRVHIPNLRLTYKTANPVKLVVYRWSTGQQTYYQTTSISSPILNDTSADYTTFIDINSDDQIVGNDILYTTGGVLENIAPSAISTLSLFQSRLFYVPAEDKNLLGFSKPVVEGTPVETSDLLTIFCPPTSAAQVNTGFLKVLSPMDDKLVLWKKDAIYYINGQGPDSTGANNQYSDPIFISSTVGSENPRSIVFIPQGLMFQSDKGIWLLGRDLSTKYIGADVESYTNEGTVQSAVNVPGTTQVRFTLDTGITLMYDYYFNQWGTFENVPAISSTLYQGLHTYLNDLGQVFQETPGAYLDGTSPVLMSFTTSWLNLAGLQGFERAYFFYLLGVYLSPHKLTVGIAYDYNSSPSQTMIITPDNFNPKYGEQDGPYGSGSPYGGISNIEQWRVFLNQQKCQAFQISITESFDASYGVMAGAGFTLSGLDVVVGIKKSYPTLKAARSVG